MRRILSFCLFLFFLIVSLQAQNKNLKDVYSSNINFKKNLSTWLNFYSIDIDDFKYDETEKLDIEVDSMSIYYRPFENKQKQYNPLNDYSPDKRKYISLLETRGVFFDDTDKQYHYDGEDDSQEIYFVDIENEFCKMIQWNGFSCSTEAIFWVSNDVFVLVTKLDGQDYSLQDYFIDMIYQIDIYEIKNNNFTCVKYKLKRKENKLNEKSYFLDFLLKQRNVKINY